MKKVKYAALLAVLVLFISAMSVMSITIGGNMHPPDGVTHQVHQTTIPPLIDGTVDVPGTWPTQALVGYMWVTGQPSSTQVAEVYALLDWLEDPGNPYVVRSHIDPGSHHYHTETQINAHKKEARGT